MFQVCIDLTGKRFGRLLVISRSANAADGHAKWLCLCDCGKYLLVQSNNLKTYHVKSCGCYIKDRAAMLNLTHGKTNTKEFKARDCMIQRCYNVNNASYKNYGGRGITVCKRWLNSFEAFYSDLGDAPSKQHSLERINNNGNYEPGNCKWATAKEQRANQRPRSEW